MKTFNATPIQFHTNDGIGLSLANAAARKRLHRARARVNASSVAPIPTGQVFDDVIALGTVALCQHVQRLLSGNPLQVIIENPDITRIRVCGAFDYVIDRNKQCVLSHPAPLTHRERASKQQPPWDHPFELPIDMVEVLNPLARPAWLEHIAARPGWFGYAFARHDEDQAQLFVDEEQQFIALSRVTRSVFYQLQRHPALVALQHALSTTLTLHIDPSLVSLAMRARVHTGNVSLTARHLNLVWRHRQAFATMEQEAPRLLPLLTAWLTHRSANVQAKLTHALPAIRQQVLAAGLPPKAWRYLVQHGMKRLLPLRTPQTTWDALINTLRALAAARWPLLPPRDFLRLLHDSAGPPKSYDLGCKDGVPGWFWQMACEEAVARRSNGVAYLEFYDRVPELAWLVREYGLRPDQNQRRKKMTWLCELAQKYREQALLDDAPAWALWLQDIPWNTVKTVGVVPLLSRGAVVKEALALHNCADYYIDACREESRVLLSLRDLRTGKRVALVCLEPCGNSWMLREVAGPCNRPVSDGVRKIVDQVTGLVRYHHSQRPLLLAPSQGE